MFSQYLPATRPEENQPRAEKQRLFGRQGLHAKFGPCDLGPPGSVENYLSTRPRKPSLLGPVCQCWPPTLATPSPSWEADPGGRHLAEAMGELRRPRRTPPPAVGSPLEEC